MACTISVSAPSQIIANAPVSCTCTITNASGTAATVKGIQVVPFGTKNAQVPQVPLTQTTVAGSGTLSFGFQVVLPGIPVNTAGTTLPRVADPTTGLQVTLYYNDGTSDLVATSQYVGLTPTFAVNQPVGSAELSGTTIGQLAFDNGSQSAWLALFALGLI